MENERTEVDTPKGKEILMYAASREQCILEFARMDDGTLTVADITDHVRALEDEVVGDG